MLIYFRESIYIYRDLNYCTFPMMTHKNIPSVDNNYWLKGLNTQQISNKTIRHCSDNE